MRGFTKFIWILFIGAIAYNIFLIINLIVISNELDELYSALNGIKSEATQGLSFKEIEARIGSNLWLKDKYETFNFTFLIANGIFGASLFYRNYYYVKDKRKVKNKVPFEKLTLQEQTDILSENFCDSCAEKIETIFKEEKILLGTPYILVNCKKCGYEIKIKDSWQ